MEIVTLIVGSFVDGSLLWFEKEDKFIKKKKKSYATVPGKEDFKKETRFKAKADNRRKSLPWTVFYRKKLAE